MPDVLKLAIIAGYVACVNPKDADKMLFLGHKSHDKKITNSAMMDNGAVVGRLKDPLFSRQQKPASLMRVRAMFHYFYDRHFNLKDYDEMNW